MAVIKGDSVIPTSENVLRAVMMCMLLCMNDSLSDYGKVLDIQFASPRWAEGSLILMHADDCRKVNVLRHKCISCLLGRCQGIGLVSNSWD